VIDHTVSCAAGNTASGAAQQHRARYQQVLRQLAVVTLVVAVPGAALAARGWQRQARMRRSWPPGGAR
jgi:hypothetical protein